MLPLSNSNNRIVLQLEQDQGRDLWIPAEDEHCVPHKQTHDFLIFLGKDPSSEDFGLKTSELEEIVATRIAIDLQPAKNLLIETPCSFFAGLLIWKDHAKNRFIGLLRNERGRYSNPQFSSSKQRLKERLLGLEERQ